MKTVVYAVTRGWYEQVLPSMKSLLYYNDIDQIYLLTETDTFPYHLPSNVRCINVKNQTFFKPDGPNWNSRYSYMAMMRAAYTKVLPKEVETVLSIDADTIVLDDISELFTLPLGDQYYVAGAREPGHSRNDFLYINCGITVMNLKKLREDGMDDRLIKELNTTFHDLLEQDCINNLCQGHIMEISGSYNACNYTIIDLPAKIRHWAGEHHGWQNNPLVKPYKNLFFEEVLAMRHK